MKRIITILLSLLMILSVAACKNFESQPEGTKIFKMQEKKCRVAYFSATNTTEGVAEHIADGLNADLYEIVPEDPYTDTDLNYNDNNSRVDSNVLSIYREDILESQEKIIDWLKKISN